MTLLGKFGFIRRQEIAFAKKLLIWKYEKSGLPLPSEAIISAHAKTVVEEAHITAKKSGKNILEILKQAVNDIRHK